MVNLPVTLEFLPVLSRADSGWSGARGYVQHALLAVQPNLSNSAVYACGSDAMIHGAKELLLENGLPVKQFYSDAFVCTSNQ
jgi:CDP-4-dehydro-6-deoxyglucose reductase